MAGATVESWFASVDAEQQFLRRYLADAWARFETADSWTTGWYWSYGQFAAYDPGPDGGYIQLVFEGKPEQFVADESDRWDGFYGLESWSLRRYEEEGYESLLAQQLDAKGEVAGEWDYRLKPLVSRFSLAYLREFEDALPAVGEQTDANTTEFGFWAVIHYTMIQCGYDWDEETAACLKAMQNRLKSIASYRGADAARSAYEQLLADLDDYGEELDLWLDEHPTGEATVE